VLIGYFLAGWLNQTYGWRDTFRLVGAPGILLAVLVPWLVREPRRRRTSENARDSPSLRERAALPGMWEIATTLWGIRSFRHLLLGVAVTYFFGYGIQLWQPSFFIRSFGMKTAELGLWLTLIGGVGGFAGTYLGGEWASRWAANNEALQLRVMGCLYCAFAVTSVVGYLATDARVAITFIALASIGINIGNGPLFSVIQTLVPDRMRAVSVAVVYLFANLIGMGLGPLATGVLSDKLQPLLGAQSLRFSLVIISPGYLWCAWHLWRASRHVQHDLSRAQMRAG